MPIAIGVERYAKDLAEWVSKDLEGTVTEAQVKRMMGMVSGELCRRLRRGMDVRVHGFIFYPVKKGLSSRERRRRRWWCMKPFVDYPAYRDPNGLDNSDWKKLSL